MQVVGVKGYVRVIAVVAALLGVLVVAIAAVPKAESQSAPQCFGKTVEPENRGTGGPDNIVGQFRAQGGRADGIKTFGGNDTVRGEADFSGTPRGNRDFICLGGGMDTADGADMTDRISGGPGNDTLDGDNFPSKFRDFLYGNTGADTFTGGQGGDVIRGGKQGDRIDVGQGTVNAGADNVAGGRGDDTINEANDNAVDVVKGGSGTDTCIVSPGDRVSGCENVRRG